MRTVPGVYEVPQILFEDPHLLVLSKPAGMLSQGEKTGDPNLVDWLRDYLGRNYIGLIHRLDRNTSGIMVVAKRSKAACRLTESLQKGELRRTYLAWFVGKISRAQTWRHWLLKDEEKNQVQVVDKKRAGAKEARLSVRPLSEGKWKGISLTLAEVELASGRSHQIRVQAAWEGHPLLGDPKYGLSQSGFKEGLFARPALHSCCIEFPHPMTQVILQFEAPLPEDLKAIHLI